MDKPFFLVIGLCVYLHALCYRRLFGGLPAEPHFYGLTIAASTLCIHISVSLRNGASEQRCLYTNMDLLVAGLQGVDPYGLYQYW
jgi:hypothetical protein